MRIGIDIDGVLADCNAGITAAVAKYSKADLSEIITNKYDLSSVFAEYGVDNIWFDKLFNTETFWPKLTPHEDNIQAVRDLADLGHEIYLVTGRPRIAAVMPTKAWMKKHKIPYTEIAYTEKMHKVDYLKQKEITVMVEDFFFEANKIAANGIKCYVIRRPWNEEFEPRVTNTLVKYVTSIADVDELQKVEV